MVCLNVGKEAYSWGVRWGTAFLPALPAASRQPSPCSSFSFCPNLKPKWVLWGLLGMRFTVFYLLSEHGGAPPALGRNGGWLSVLFILRSVTGRVAKPQLQRPSYQKQVRAQTRRTCRLHCEPEQSGDRACVVDRILDKINERASAPSRERRNASWTRPRRFSRSESFP